MSSITETSRNHCLDYLRGLAACSIMIFHYSSWSFGQFQAGTFLGRIGLYGVSVFYVLSGVTLYFTYAHRLNSLDDLSYFYRKRFWRIFPLLWFATAFAIIVLFLRGISVSTVQVFLNFTGLFGIVAPDQYIATGAWSIGNELVFYLFFPVLVFLSRSKAALITFSGFLLLIYLYFAFFVLDPKLDLALTQWSTYVNPLNQVFLFASGFLIGHFFQGKKYGPLPLILLFVVSAVVFIFLPASGDRISLVTGFNRLIFSGCSIAVCFSFYKLRVNPKKFIDAPLRLLGEASYSVYLLHPIIWDLTGAIEKRTFQLPIVVKLILCFGLTLFSSYFVYKYIEVELKKFGSRKKILSHV